MSDSNIELIMDNKETQPGTSGNVQVTHETQTGRSTHIKEEPLVIEVQNPLKRKASLVRHKSNKRRKIHFEQAHLLRKDSLINHELLTGQHPIMSQDTLVYCQMFSDNIKEQESKHRESIINNEQDLPRMLPVATSQNSLEPNFESMAQDNDITTNKELDDLEEPIPTPVARSTAVDITISEETFSTRLEITLNTTNNEPSNKGDDQDLAEAHHTTFVDLENDLAESKKSIDHLDLTEKEYSILNDSIEQPDTNPILTENKDEKALEPIIPTIALDDTIEEPSLVTGPKTISVQTIRSYMLEHPNLYSLNPKDQESVNQENLDSDPLTISTQTSETNMSENRTPKEKEQPLTDHESVNQSLEIVRDDTLFYSAIVSDPVTMSTQTSDTNMLENPSAYPVIPIVKEEPLTDLLIKNENVESFRSESLENSIETEKPSARQNSLVEDVPKNMNLNLFTNQEPVVSHESIGTAARNMPYPSHFRCLSGTIAPYSIIHKASATDIPGSSNQTPHECTCAQQAKTGAYNFGAPMSQTISASTCPSRNKSSMDEIFDYTMPQKHQRPLPKKMPPPIQSSTICCQQQKKCKSPPKKICCEEEYFSLSSESSEDDDCGVPISKQKFNARNIGGQPCPPVVTNYKACSSTITNYKSCASNATNYQPCASSSNAYQTCTSTMTTMSASAMGAQPQPVCSSTASDRGNMNNQTEIVQLLRQLVHLVEGGEHSDTCDTSCDVMECAPAASGAISEEGGICNTSEIDPSAFNTDEICFNSTAIEQMPPAQCVNSTVPCNVFISPNMQCGPRPFCLMPVNDQPGIYELTLMPDDNVTTNAAALNRQKAGPPNPDVVSDPVIIEEEYYVNQEMTWEGNLENMKVTPTSSHSEYSNDTCEEQDEQCLREQSNRRAAPKRQQAQRNESNGGECNCCHCRAMRNNAGNGQDGGGAQLPGMNDASNIMKFFVDSLIMDLEAMEHARNKKQFEQSVCKPTNFPRQSFPVTITDVTDLGSSSLYVKWCIHDCYGIGGYEIYVDGYLTNRYFHCNHEAAVICEIDVSRPHKIVLLAVPRIENDDELCTGKTSNVCKSAMQPFDASKYQSSSDTNSSCPGNNVCPKAPGNLWVPSIYLYDPSCRQASTPIIRKY